MIEYSEIEQALLKLPGVKKVYNLYPDVEHLHVHTDVGKCRAYTISVYCSLDEENPPDLAINVGEQLGVKMQIGK